MCLSLHFYGTKPNRQRRSELENSSGAESRKFFLRTAANF